MKRFNLYRKYGRRLCKAQSTSEELKTRQGLALTPSDVARLTSQGMPVNTENAQMFYDGDTNPSPYVTSERRRGVDVAELWEQHQKLIASAKRAHKHALKQSKKNE